MTAFAFSDHYVIYTIKTRREFQECVGNGDGGRVADGLAQKGLQTGWLGVVDTRSQPVASRRLSAGWLTCCYSRRATRQTGLGAKPLVIIKLRRLDELVKSLH